MVGSNKTSLTQIGGEEKGWERRVAWKELVRSLDCGIFYRRISSVAAEFGILEALGNEVYRFFQGAKNPHHPPRAGLSEIFISLPLLTEEH